MGCASSNEAVVNDKNDNNNNNSNDKSIDNDNKDNNKDNNNINTSERRKSSRSSSPRKSGRRRNSTKTSVKEIENNDNDNDINKSKEVKDTSSKVYNNNCASYNRGGYMSSYPEKENHNAIIQLNKIYGVIDGHGEHGKQVADHLISLLPKAFKDIDTSISDANTSLTTSVRYLSEKLAKSSINTYLSGATLCFSYVDDNNIYTANVGDCKCLIGRYDHEKSEIVAKLLTTDHTCDNKEEQKRILDSGGRVRPLIGPNDDDSGPNRVWLSDIDVPGLLVTRTIGDRLAQSVGITWAPEIRTNKLTDDDCFIFWATPSLFEFFSNGELMKLITQFLYRENRSIVETIRLIVNECRRRWRDEEDVIDDISCILLQLKSKLDE